MTEIEISTGLLFLWCPHDVAIGRTGGDDRHGAGFCNKCADAWDAGAEVVIRR